VLRHQLSPLQNDQSISAPNQSSDLRQSMKFHTHLRIRHTPARHRIFNQTFEGYSIIRWHMLAQGARIPPVTLTTAAPKLDGGRLCLNLALTTPLFPCGRVIFPQMTRVLV
jgi:hypothetical protein